MEQAYIISLNTTFTCCCRSINKRSRELLGQVPYSTYGSVATSQEDVERALLSSQSAEEDGGAGATRTRGGGDGGDESGTEMTAAGRRRDSRSSQDIAFDR